MNNPPAFQFYPKDFLADINVQAMNLEERGAYITLLCLCWLEDGIPKETLEKIVDLYLTNSFNKTSTETQLWPQIKHCFYEKDGKWRNKRLDEERQKQIMWSEKCRKGGLKSAENKRLIKGSSTKPQLKVNKRLTKGQLKVNTPVFSLQSSSSDKSISRDILVVIQKKWNEFAEKKNLPSILDIKPNSAREAHLKERIADKDWDLDKLLEQIANSPFLLGQNKENFRVTFDWAIKPSNYQKIIEGNYIDRKRKAGSDDWAERREREEQEKTKKDDEEVEF